MKHYRFKNAPATIYTEVTIKGAISALKDFGVQLPSTIEVKKQHSHTWKDCPIGMAYPDLKRPIHLYHIDALDRKHLEAAKKLNLFELQWALSPHGIRDDAKGVYLILEDTVFHGIALRYDNYSRVILKDYPEDNRRFNVGRYDKLHAKTVEHVTMVTNEKKAR